MPHINTKTTEINDKDWKDQDEATEPAAILLVFLRPQQ